VRTLFTLTLLAALAGPLAAQKSKEPDPPKLVEKPAVRVEGYKTYLVQGFTVLIADDVFGEAAAKFERPPLEVLDRELGTVVRVVNAKSAAALRRLIIWVEWDDADKAMENGRPGTAVAVYRGGSPQAMAAGGLHPLKANTVDVLNMKSLTVEHQPKRDSGRCVLLHEFAHAVHSQLLGRDNPAIREAFAQAMQRKLYDLKTQYAATNPQEFFAELSCCYLDSLNYFPKTRDDLKSHDPATYKLMQTVWAGSAAAGGKGATTEATSSADLSVKLADIAFGEPIQGAKFDPAAAAGKVVVVAYWGGTAANLLDRVAKLQADLGPYDLVVVAPYPYVTPIDEVEKDAAARGPKLDVPRGGFVVDPADPQKRVNLKPPETLVFNPAGVCVFRGSGYDADKPARAAVGAKLLADLGTDPLPPAFKAVSAAFAAGATPTDVIPKVAPLLASQDATTKALARKLADAILAPLNERLAAATAQAKETPVDAFLALEELQVAGKGTPVAGKAATLIDRLRGKPEVAAELRARPLLRQIETLHSRLAAAEGAFEPASPRFQSRNSVPLAQLTRLVAELKTRYPKSRAAERAEKLAMEFGVAD
jgi:hypothetical protein